MSQNPLRSKSRGPVILRPENVQLAHLAAETHLTGWQLCDRSLERLRIALSGDSVEEVLAKATVVNSLYGTNVYAMVPVAQHVSNVLTTSRHCASGAELVDQMAAVSVVGRKFVSFASKYAHFFIDRERYPIYDSFAVKMIAFHLGSKSLGSGGGAYARFSECFNRLAEQVGIVTDRRRLDRYLWLAGIGRELRRNPKALVNAEVRKYFQDHPAAPFVPEL